MFFYLFGLCLRVALLGTAVDIYAFGMVLLEMIGREQPWSECETAGQVYKKVMAGERPRNL